MDLKIGNSVVVKKGTIEPTWRDFEIGAYQGRIIEIDSDTNKDDILVKVEWDSLTLEQLPHVYIEQSAIGKFDWQRSILKATDLNKTNPRDEDEQVKETQKKISYQYYWYSFGEEGVRIANILNKTNRSDEKKCLERWDKHLDTQLSFPIQAIISKYAQVDLTKSGDVLQINSLSTQVDTDGIMAEVELNGNTFEIPLFDLLVLDKKSLNFQLVNDYQTWFSDRF